MLNQHQIESWDLRAALDVPDGFDRYKHREMVEDVRRVHPHTVIYRELINDSTCVSYTFGLFRDKTYRAVAGNFGRKIFAGRQFMEWLTQNHLQGLGRPASGCLAMYFADGVWQHVGVVSGAGRVISQWGTFPVYEHGVCEVPARYGDAVRYFQKLRPDEGLKLFLEFSRTRGLSDIDMARVIR